MSATGNTVQRLSEHLQAFPEGSWFLIAAFSCAVAAPRCSEGAFVQPVARPLRETVTHLVKYNTTGLAYFSVRN